MRFMKLLMALGLGSVASLAGAQDPQKLPPSRTVDTVNAVTVANQRPVPVWVFLAWGRFDRRLGLVAPGATQTLQLPSWAYRGVSNARFYVYPRGEPGELETEHFRLPKAARLTLTIPPRAEAKPLPDTMSEVIPPEELDEATLTVENPRTVSVTIFAEQRPFYVRLGKVAARGRETLRFPRSVLSPNRQILIVVHVDGDGDLEVMRRTVARGDHLGLRVPYD